MDKQEQPLPPSRKETAYFLKYASYKLRAISQAPEQEARYLCSLVRGRSGAALLVDTGLWSEIEIDRLEKLLVKRVEQRVPLQYLLESVPFGDLLISIAPPVLIPRPETEEWVVRFLEKYQDELNPEYSFLDACTGSGCIGLLVAHKIGTNLGYGLDLADHAVALARKNASDLNLPFTVFQDDLESYLSKSTLQVDTLFSNPPYLRRDELDHLEPELAWEDQDALDGGSDGLRFYRLLALMGQRVVKPEKRFMVPQIVLEIGAEQRSQVTSLFEAEGYRTECWQDMAGNDRVILCWKL